MALLETYQATDLSSSFNGLGTQEIGEPNFPDTEFRCLSAPLIV